MTDKDAKDLTSLDQTGEGESKEEGPGDQEPPDDSSVIPEEILKKLPPEARRVVQFGMMQRFGPMPNPLTSKLTESHIDKILDISAKDDERYFADAKHARWFTLGYVVLFLALFVFLTIFLVGEDKELYKEALKLVAVFVGGFGGGFGVKSYMDREK
jgi:hypothetical protein